MASPSLSGNVSAVPLYLYQHCNASEASACSGLGKCNAMTVVTSHLGECACPFLFDKAVDCSLTYFAVWGDSALIYGIVMLIVQTIIFTFYAGEIILDVLTTIRRRWRNDPDRGGGGSKAGRPFFLNPVFWAKTVAILHCSARLFDHCFYIVNTPSVNSGSMTMLQAMLPQRVLYELGLLLFVAFCALIVATWTEIMEKGRTLSEKTFLSWYRWVLLVSISIIAATDITATIVASSIPEYRYTIGTITNYLVGGYGLLVVFTSVAALIRGSKFWNMTNGDNEKAARRQRTVRLISIYLIFAIVFGFIYIALVGSSAFFMKGGTSSYPWPHFTMHCCYRFSEVFIMTFGFLFCESHTIKKGLFHGYRNTLTFGSSASTNVMSPRPSTVNTKGEASRDPRRSKTVVTVTDKLDSSSFRTATTLEAVQSVAPGTTSSSPASSSA